MFDFLADVPAKRQTDEEADEDFDARYATAGPHDCWKLERRQHFREPWSDSWVAFARGDWDEALRLNAAHKEGLAEQRRKSAGRGIRHLRVRVVELPITPYLQWELEVLRNRVACGDLIRVVSGDAVRSFEDEGLVPELINVGTDALYQTLYDDDGLAYGSIRYDSVKAVTRYSALMKGIYTQGVDLEDFFRREIAHLPPPAGDPDALAAEGTALDAAEQGT